MRFVTAYLVALLAVTSASAQLGDRPVRTISAVPTGSCAINGEVRVINTSGDKGEHYCCISGTWGACPDGSLTRLNHVAASGAGTSGDPWVITSTEWDTVKGAPITVPVGYYQVAHGAKLDVSDGTFVLCEPGAIFVLPSSQRTNSDSMFKIAADADDPGVGFFGCEFSPGISVTTTDMCQSGTDTSSGANYIQVGADGEDGQPHVVVDSCKFGPARRKSSEDNAHHIRFYTGSYNSTITGNIFEIAYNMIQFRVSDDAVTETHHDLEISGNRFDMQSYSNVACGQAGFVLAANENAGAGNDFVFDGLRVINNYFHNPDFGLNLLASGSDLTFASNEGDGTFFDGYLRVDPPSGGAFYGVTVADNACNDEGATTVSQGCEFFIHDTTGFSITGNNLHSTGTHPVSVFNSSGGTIAANAFNRADNSGAGIATCFYLSAANDTTIASNTCIDASYMVQIAPSTSSSDIHVVGNLHGTEDAAASQLVTGFEVGSGATCSNCSFAFNRVAGQDYTDGDWSNDRSQVAFFAGNQWQSTTDPIMEVSGLAIARSDGTTISFEPGGYDVSQTLRIPGAITRGGWQLSIDRQGAMRFLPSGYTTDIGGAYTFPSGNSGSWTDAANAIDETWSSEAKYLSSSGGSSTVTHDYTWTTASASSFVLEAFVGITGDVANTKCESPADIELFVSYCTGSSCTPSTEFGRSIGTTYMERFIVDVGSQDPADVGFRVSCVENAATGPARCSCRLYQVGLTTATNVTTPPKSLRNPLLPGTAANEHGVTLWGDSASTAHDTGDEVCALHGLTCDSTLELATPQEVACSTTQSGEFIALCHE